jgi:hypothetical protein
MYNITCRTTIRNYSITSLPKLKESLFISDITFRITYRYYSITSLPKLKKSSFVYYLSYYYFTMHILYYVASIVDQVHFPVEGVLNEDASINCLLPFNNMVTCSRWRARHSTRNSSIIFFWNHRRHHPPRCPAADPKLNFLNQIWLYPFFVQRLKELHCALI